MDPGWLQWFGIFIIKKIQLKFGVGMMEQARKRRNYRYIFLDNLQREGGGHVRWTDIPWEGGDSSSSHFTLQKLG